MVERGEFAEHAFVHGNRYGTAQAPIEAALAAGRDVIFDVDWQGGAALSARWPETRSRSSSCRPISRRSRRACAQRATDAPEVIERRLRKAIEELEHYTEYQHLIVNDDLDRAYEVLRAIYLTRRYGAVDRPDVAYPLAAARADRRRESRGRGARDARSQADRTVSAATYARAVP